MVIPYCRNDHLRDSCERTPFQLLVPVHLPAGNKHGEAEHGERYRDREADPPPNVVLHPDKRRRRQQGAQVDGEEEPIEEGALVHPLRRVGAIELVGAKSRGAGLDATGPDGDEIEPQVHRSTMTAAAAAAAEGRIH